MWMIYLDYVAATMLLLITSILTVHTAKAAIIYKFLPIALAIALSISATARVMDWPI